MMIDFACKKIELREIIKCSFNLNKTEYNILLKLLKAHDKFSIVKISELTGFERSTVQKAVKKLVKQKLLVKTQVNMSRGGYLFKYKTKDKMDIKSRIVSAVQSWSSRAEREVMDW
ncbi:MAG: MarR family transcriptional regulator [Nanoarchaeota archaeon]|nr:MarR family transcriptional regulator [Nanoarchaeota archaeon]